MTDFVDVFFVILRNIKIIGNIVFFLFKRANNFSRPGGEETHLYDKEQKNNYVVFATSASKKYLFFAPQANICISRNSAVRKCYPKLIPSGHHFHVLKSKNYSRKCTILCFP